MAGKTGDAFDLEVKLQRRYEKEEELGVPQTIMEWVASVVPINYTPPTGVYDYRSIHMLLKDGCVLCRLINTLFQHEGLPKFPFKAKVKSSFVAISNIDTFCIASKNYGVSDNCIFQSSDLYDGRKSQMLSVLYCLNQLGNIANSRGFFPMYQSVPPPKPDFD